MGWPNSLYLIGMEGMSRALRLHNLGLFVGLLGTGLLAPQGSVLAAGAFDGTYVGTQRTTLNNNSGACDRLDRDDLRRTVTDGVITTQWGSAKLQAKVGPDGSFAVTDENPVFGRAGSGPNPVTLKGTIRDGRLEADLGSSHCGVHWSLRKG